MDGIDVAVTDDTAADTEVAPARAIELIDAGAVLIDVRRPYEYEVAAWPGRATSR